MLSRAHIYTQIYKQLHIYLLGFLLLRNATSAAADVSNEASYRDDPSEEHDDHIPHFLYYECLENICEFDRFVEIPARSWIIIINEWLFKNTRDVVGDRSIEEVGVELRGSSVTKFPGHLTKAPSICTWQGKSNCFRWFFQCLLKALTMYWVV